MAHSCRRYDISDAVCSLLELHLPKRLRRISQRKSSVHIHVVFLIMRTGHRGRIYYRIMVIGAMRTAVLFARVCGKDLLETLIDDSDYERIMIDVSHCKAHPHAAGATGGNQHESQKRGSNSKIHLAVGAHYLLADCGYDSNAIIEQAREQNMKAAIPPKRNRRTQRFYDKELYKCGILTENVFLHLKSWRDRHKIRQ